MVRVFDVFKRVTVGEVDLMLEIGPCQFDIPFIVVDISVTSNMLCCLPLIHDVGAIPSSLHQRVKFIKKDKLITIMVEKRFRSVLIQSFLS